MNFNVATKFKVGDLVQTSLKIVGYVTSIETTIKRYESEIDTQVYHYYKLTGHVAMFNETNLTLVLEK